MSFLKGVSEISTINKEPWDYALWLQRMYDIDSEYNWYTYCPKCGSKQFATESYPSCCYCGTRIDKEPWHVMYTEKSSQTYFRV